MARTKRTAGVDRPLVRRKIREVLAMAPDRRFTEGMLLDAVRQLVPFEVPESELRVGLEWNQESGYVDWKYSRDMDRDEWFLTARGLAKEGVQGE